MPNQQDERGDPLNRTHGPGRESFTARETRQGGLGRPVLIVLAASLALAILVWGAVEIWGRSAEPTVDTEQAPSTSSDTQTLSQDKIDNTVPSGSQAVPTDRVPTHPSTTGGDNQGMGQDGTGN